MRRSAYSISSNIAEGCSRNGNNEFLQFLGIAKGSLAELKTQTIVAYRIEILAKDKYDMIIVQTDKVGRMLNALQNSLKKPLSNQQPATSDS